MSAEAFVSLGTLLECLHCEAVRTSYMAQWIAPYHPVFDESHKVGMLHSGWGAPVVRRLSGDSAVPGMPSPIQVALFSSC